MKHFKTQAYKSLVTIKIYPNREITTCTLVIFTDTSGKDKIPSVRLETNR